MKREKRKQLKTNDETISQKVRNKTKENEKIIIRFSGFEQAKRIEQEGFAQLGAEPHSWLPKRCKEFDWVCGKQVWLFSTRIYILIIIVI
jgi:hypothetical protein